MRKQLGRKACSMRIRVGAISAVFDLAQERREEFPLGVQLRQLVGVGRVLANQVRELQLFAALDARSPRRENHFGHLVRHADRLMRGI